MSTSQMAAQVAAAEQILAEAERQHAEARAEHERRAARLAVLQSELASIAERRQAGDKEDADGPRVALLKLDIAQLSPLVNIAKAEAATALQGVLDARAALAHAQQQLERETAQQQAEALENRLRQIETVLVNGIAELAKLKRRIDPRLSIAPTTVYPLGDPLRRYATQSVMPK